MQYYSGDFSRNIKLVTGVKKRRVTEYGVWLYKFILGGAEYCILPHDAGIPLRAPDEAFAVDALVQDKLSAAAEAPDVSEASLRTMYSGSGTASCTFGLLNDGTGVFYWHGMSSLCFLGGRDAAVLAPLFYSGRRSAQVVKNTLEVSGITDTKGNYAFYEGVRGHARATYFVEECANRRSDPLSGAEEFLLLQQAFTEAGLLNRNPSVHMDKIPVYRITDGSTVAVSGVRAYMHTTLGILYQTMHKKWGFMYWNISKPYSIDHRFFPFFMLEGRWHVLVKDAVLCTNLDNVAETSQKGGGAGMMLLHFGRRRLMLFRCGGGYFVSGYVGDVYKLQETKDIAYLVKYLLGHRYRTEGGYRSPSAEEIRMNMACGASWDGSRGESGAAARDEAAQMSEEERAAHWKWIKEKGLDSDLSDPVYYRTPRGQ